jgi:hypothetical protein
MARKNNENITQVDHETFIVKDQALIVFDKTAQRTIQATGAITVGDASENVIFWGERNTLPDERELLIQSNNIVPQLIATKRNLILGQGLMAYREEFENGEKKIVRVQMPDEIAEWLEENEIEEKYLPTAVKNLLIHGNIFTEFEPLRGGGHKIKIIESRYVRAQKQNEQGIIPRYHIYGDWSLLTNGAKIQETERKPTTIAAYSKERFEAGRKCLMQCADTLLGGPYYYAPHWEGATTWIKVANCIPEFHHNNLRNGYTIRYLIKVPQDYFVQSMSESMRRKKDTDIQEFAKHEQLLRQNFVDRANKFFSGTENAGRAWITSTFKERFGNNTSTSEITIEPIDVNLQDEAMLKLFESSNSANTSSHGTPPALAGIATGAKMTSGSEIRNLYNFYQLAVAPMPRKLILKPINTVLKPLLKQNNIKIGFIDVKLATTDTHRSGTVETQIEE